MTESGKRVHVWLTDEDLECVEFLSEAGLSPITTSDVIRRAIRLAWTIEKARRDGGRATLHRSRRSKATKELGI